MLICRGVRLQAGIISVKPDADGLLAILRDAFERGYQRGRQNEARNREATDQSGRGNSDRSDYDRGNSRSDPGYRGSGTTGYNR